MLRSVNLEDYMVDKPITVAPETPLIEAVDLITKNRVSGLCVSTRRVNCWVFCQSWTA